MKISINDERIANDYGFYIRNSGIDLSRFVKNNILLKNHDCDDLAIGNVENVAIEGSSLVGDAIFDKEDKDPENVAFIDKFERGVMKGFSAGIMILEMVEEIDPFLGSKYVATKSELYEVSAVTIPSNKNAVKLMNKGGLTFTSSKGELMQLSFNDDGKLNFLTQNKEVSMKEIAKALGLSDTASEMECVSSIVKLKTASELAHKAQVENLITLGKSKGLINETNEPSYRIMLASSFDAAKVVIETAETPKAAAGTEGAKVEGVTNLTTAFKTLVDQVDESGKTDEKETFDWLSKNDPKKLASIKANDSEKYKKLVAAYTKK